MLMPFAILAGIMAVLTTPGLIAQHLAARRAKAIGSED
jgi:hypothetical protein